MHSIHTRVCYSPVLHNMFGCRLFVLAMVELNSMCVAVIQRWERIGKGHRLDIGWIKLLGEKGTNINNCLLKT